MDREREGNRNRVKRFCKRGEKLVKSISMSLVSIHLITSIFYRLWHYFFNKIHNLPCFVSWPKCCKSMSRRIYFLIYKVLWLLSYLIYKFLRIPKSFRYLAFKNLFVFSFLVLSFRITVFVTDGSTDTDKFFGIHVQGSSTSDFIAQNLHSDLCTHVKFQFLTTNYLLPQE